MRVDRHVGVSQYGPSYITAVPTGHQGPVSWKTIFFTDWGLEGRFWNDSSTLHLLCTSTIITSALPLIIRH